MYNLEMDCLADFTFRNVNVSRWNTECLLYCLAVDTDRYKHVLLGYETSRKWTAQKRRKQAETFKSNVLNELLRREQDAIQSDQEVSE